MLAPICLFTYNRLSETQQTIEALKKNFLASKSDLFVFSDGPKNAGAKLKVEDVREYLRSINGFKSVTIFESEENKGLAKSIISGVTQIIKKEGKVIVLEDDLITAPNFLDFMNQALDSFEYNDKVFSISGYTLNLPSLSQHNKDYYFAHRASSWGWATWTNRWESVDWQVRGWQNTLINPYSHYMFGQIGSDMPFMLWRQMNGKIDSWAIRWCYTQFKKKMVTVFPSKSKIFNIGFGDSATHTKKTNRFNTLTDKSEQTNFKFDNDIELKHQLIKEFRSYYSIKTRIKEKLR